MPCLQAARQLFMKYKGSASWQFYTAIANLGMSVRVRVWVWLRARAN